MEENHMENRGKAPATGSLSRCTSMALRGTPRGPLYGSSALVALAVLVPTASAGQFPAIFELSMLDGSNGFVLHGIASRDESGYSVSAAGDVNGDGVGDLFVGAPHGDPNGRDDAGEAYVVFGGPTVGMTGTLELSGLDSTMGIVLLGIAADDLAGLSVSGAGDVNCDAYADVVVGAFTADPHQRWDAGQAYVVFGGRNVSGTGKLDLADLDGTNGFALSGTYIQGEAGGSVSRAGDLNGDGCDDVIVGADWADPGARNNAGQTYVVFGGTSPINGQAELILPRVNGVTGIALNGIGSQDFSGRSVGDAGDVNGDGFNDVIIGAHGADPDGLEDAGEAYVLFGHPPPFSAQIELSDLNGTNGFVIACSPLLTYCGVSVSGAGDVNGDGHDDILVGAPAGNPNGMINAGITYVVFGGTGLGAGGRVSVADLDGSNGFVINGESAGDWFGREVRRAGDLNGDGVDDIVICAMYADPEGKEHAGKTYVIFGRAGLGSGGVFDLASLDGNTGFVLNGVAAGDRSGQSAAGTGDVNGDGIDDLLIGAPFASPNGEWSGESYVVFGRAVDTDDDGIADRNDNCTLLANADQRDTDGDGYGNACDPDLDNSGIVNFTDLGILKSVFFTSDPDADFNGDGRVNFTDLGTMKSFFFLPPGPSGLAEERRSP
jgi:hypothetical protein